MRPGGGSWYLGAADPRAPRRRAPPPADAVGERAARGLRVLLLACAEPDADLRDADGHPRLPALRPVALVALADELRPEAAEAIRLLRAGGVALKVLSGDDPRTVAALAARAGIDVGGPHAPAAVEGGA